MKFLNNLWAFYGRHLKIIRVPFEAILEDAQLLTDLRSRKHRNHFVFPILVSTVIMLDTAINDHYPEEQFRTRAPYHHMVNAYMPKIFRESSTSLFVCLYLLSFCGGLFSYLNSYPHTDFILYYHNGELTYPYRKENYRKVESDMARKLIAFFQRYRNWMESIWLFLIIELDCAFALPVWVGEIYLFYSSNGETLPTFRVMLVAIVSPFYTRFFVSIINSGLRFMIQNVVIQIQQLHNLSKMALKPFASMRSLRRGYYHWHRTMDHILDITRCIDNMNRFYSIYVTTQIASYGVLGCRALNLVASKWDEAPFLQIMPWMVYGSVYLLNLWLFNVFSSRTIYLNVRLFKALRQLQIQLLSVRGLSLTKVVKLDLLNEYKLLLHKCSFKLVTSVTINNKLFAFQIFGFVSVFWMKLSANEEVVFL